MPNHLNENGKVVTENPEKNTNESHHIINTTLDWSDTTKELLNTLPQVWTRGLLYCLVIFISIALPWSIFSKIDETGTARGRIEPKEITVKLDAAVAGTVSEIRVKEGDLVKAGQVLLVLESELVKTDLQQAQDQLEGQLNRLNQLKLLQSQLTLALFTQQQQNRYSELEKQTQIDQAQESLENLGNTYDLGQAEKKAQLNQVEVTLKNSKTAHKLAKIRLANAQREINRYHDAWQEGIASEIQIIEKEDIAQEKQKVYEQAKSDIKQAQLRLAEQHSIYQKSIKQSKADIEQAKLRLKEQTNSLQTLTYSNALSILKIEEQIKNNDTDIETVKTQISQTQSQIKALKFQLSQRTLKAPVSGIIFELPIQKAGAVVQTGTRVAEIASQNSPLILRAQMPTTDSGSLRPDLTVKLKFDAYPFQDYGIVQGKLLRISPTTSFMETPNGKVEAYKLEISLNQTCIKTANQCIPLRPGDTAMAEVILRQKRIIDFVLDPFNQLQKGGLKL